MSSLKLTPFEFLERRVYKGEWLTDNHENYTFLEFWDTFYSSDKFETVKRKFNYQAKKLVDMGMCLRMIDYTTARDRSVIGRSTIITYQPLITRKQSLNNEN